MPRPQLAVGTYGHIKSTKQPDGLWVSMARYRDADGETRRVKAQGKSKSAAEAALREKFKGRSKSGGTAELKAESTIAELCERYLAVKRSEDLALGTLHNMGRTIDNHIVPRIGKLKLWEATPQRLQAAVSAVTELKGPGAAQMMRTNLSGMFALAARWGAVPSNPVQYTQRPKSDKKEIRALSIEELLRMRRFAAEKLRPFTYEERFERAKGDKSRMGGQNRDPRLLDVIDFLLATGCRRAEAPGLAWADVHLDDPVPWVKVWQQVVYVPGRGLFLSETKERDQRYLRLPGFAVDMLLRRREQANHELVFPSQRGTLLSPSNINVAWGKVFDAESEWAWVTPKTLRKTVATLVDAQHGSELASKQLGHASDKMTRAFYIAPSLVPVDAGSALDFFGARELEA